MNLLKYVFATTNFPAFHWWEDAKNYLSYPHRHLFGVEVKFHVLSNDRELEFIRLKELLDDYIDNTFRGKTFKYSCEDIAEMIIKHFVEIGLPIAYCKISEDNENGAEIWLTDGTPAF
jgi:hypothetical protein